MVFALYRWDKNGRIKHQRSFADFVKSLIFSEIPHLESVILANERHSHGA